MKTAPDYCLKNSGVSTQRQWRRYKRKHMKDALKAMKELLKGCAFAPSESISGLTVPIILHQLEELAALWSPEKWGR
jgi:hypothetical protein